MTDQQVMIYEIKSSADKNSSALFHENGQYFYWNQKMFRNLNIGDYVFVVNTHSKYVLFTKVESKDIPIHYNSATENSTFTNKGQDFSVRGKWDDFVCLDIIHRLDIPNNWEWKSLGSSETTYLNGNRVNLKSSVNRLSNIQSLKEISQENEINNILEQCEVNFYENKLYPEIIEAANSDHILRLCKETKFRFQKARDKLKEFDNFNLLSKKEITRILSDFKESNKTYTSYLNGLSNSSLTYKLFKLMGELISYCDLHAANKKELNEYEDNRTIARVGVRQTEWILQLLAYKEAGNDLNVLSSSIKNVIDYIRNPSLGTTMLSENHREMVSLYLLDKSKHIKDEFVSELKSFFQPYKINVVNEDNRTFIYGNILYLFDDVKKLWFENISGLVTCSNSGFLESAIGKLDNNNAIVLSWDKVPSGGNKTLNLLKENFDNEDSPFFYIYYVVNQEVKYRAKIVDFAKKIDYKEKKWNENNDVAWYNEKFDDYSENNNGSSKQAKIVFLADEIEELISPFQTNNFKFYKNYEAPTHNDLQPYVELRIKEEQRSESDLINELKLVGYENAQEFYRKIDNLIQFLRLKKGDIRITYNCKRNYSLSLTIGQRYCFCYYTKSSNNWGFITSEKLEELKSDEIYKFKGKPEAYFNETNDIQILNANFNKFKTACLIELERTHKTGHLDHKYLAFEDSIYDDDYRRYIFNVAFNKTTQKNMESHLNTILFGPPGTGKTFNSVNESLKIINEAEEQALDWNNRDEVKALFDRRVEEGRIMFTTFHQSMSYEDFIEGIKPITKNNEVTYEVQDGIFKKICKEASKKTKKLIKIGDEDSEQVDENTEMSYELFKEYYDDFVSDLPSSTKKESNTKLTTRYGKTFELFKNSSNSIVVKAGNKRTPMSLSYNELSKVYFENKTPMYKSYASVVIEEILENVEVVNETSDNFTQPYVLIIDEINRGNIASIFGELITLIEPDKREGCEEEIELILPYSKELFKVPNNVFIIGTMNTADRSVEALDTALRRRFYFQEMPPKPKLIKKVGDSSKVGGVISVNKGVDNIDLEALLKTINKRIEKLIDKDHKIGHSYFLKVDNEKKLKDCFKNKIIPLLEEYFFGDFGKIGLVLGDSFVEKINTEFNFANFKGYDPDIVSDLKEREVYKIKPKIDWDFNSVF
ncbi:McrB family protein [Aestuariivivens sediminicola]|uniref:McrB family protein n=1 Tax=Aestuariivivens sediminicola TaxID=2913560 RepID=UPI001F58ED5C|nr:AAA family ATPase [Aestuariivivens sediminicola]